MNKSTDFQSLLATVRRWIRLESADSCSGLRFRKWLVLFFVFHLSLFPSIQFAETSKGPDAEKIPDLDDVISSDSAGAKSAPADSPKADADSISDLEKAMEDGGSKGQAAASSAPKAASASTAKSGGDPEDLEAVSKATPPGGDDALGLPTDGEVGQAGKDVAKPDTAPADNAASQSVARDTAGTDDAEDLEKLSNGGAKGGTNDLDALGLPADAAPAPASAPTVPAEPPPAVAEKVALPPEPEVPAAQPAPKASPATPKEDFPIWKRSLLLPLSPRPNPKWGRPFVRTRKHQTGSPISSLRWMD